MKLLFTPLALLALSTVAPTALARPASHVSLKGGDETAVTSRHGPLVARTTILGQTIPQHQSAKLERRQHQPNDRDAVEVDQDDRDFVVVADNPVKAALSGAPVNTTPRQKENAGAAKKTDGKSKGSNKVKRQSQYGVVNNVGSNPSGQSSQAQARPGPALPLVAPAAKRSLERRQGQVGVINNVAQVAPNASAAPNANAAPSAGPPGVPGVPGAPARKRSEGMRKDEDTQDLVILMKAHFLTSLIASFYNSALARFSLNDFKAAGYADWVHGRYEQMKENAKTHDKFLATALELGKESTDKKKEAVKECEFGFASGDVKKFVEESLVLETIVTSGLNGLVSLMNNKAYIAVLASIMSVQGRHAAWISSSVKNGTPWNSAFESPLSMNQAYTLLQKYVKSCPSSSDPRPYLKSSPTVDVQFLITGSAVAKAIPGTDSIHYGHQAILTFDLPKAYEGKRLYAALVRGTGTVFAPLSSRPESNNGTKEKMDDRKVEMNMVFPRGMGGAVYVAVVTEESMSVKEEKVVAGPGMAWFEFDSRWVG